MNLLGQSHQSWKEDGLNSLNYILVKTERYQLYTKVMADVSERQIITSTTSKRITTLSVLITDKKSTVNRSRFFLMDFNGKKGKNFITSDN